MKSTGLPKKSRYSQKVFDAQEDKSVFLQALILHLHTHLQTHSWPAGIMLAAAMLRESPTENHQWGEINILQISQMMIWLIFNSDLKTVLGKKKREKFWGNTSGINLNSVLTCRLVQRSEGVKLKRCLSGRQPLWFLINFTFTGWMFGFAQMSVCILQANSEQT